MSLFWDIYESIEKTFFNSLTKKLLSFLFLLVSYPVISWVYVSHQNAVEILLKKAGVAGPVVDAVMVELSAGLWVISVLGVISLVAMVGLICYMRFLIVRPLKKISGIFLEISRGEGDFSHDLPLITNDELRELALSYNQFAQKMRQIIGEVRKMSVNIAGEAALVKVRVDETAQGAERQTAMTDRVFEASNESTKAIENVSASAHRISGSTAENLDSARSSLIEMVEIADKINRVSDRVDRFNTTVDELHDRSESVKKITSLIRDVADQTNLLALNAAIEAARAGEAGRGFAVVADEVRKLAERVNAATTEISGNINGMLSIVSEARNENEQINLDVRQTRDVVVRSADQFRAMLGGLEVTSEQLSDIATAMEKLTATNGQVHENVMVIHDLSAEVSSHMHKSELSAVVLAQATEAVQELVSRFKIGHGSFDFAVDRARIFRDQVQQALNEMSVRGVSVFDRSYQPISGTNPQKYKVSWGDEFGRHCQGYMEQCLGEIPGSVFAVAVTEDSYLSAHNLKFSKPLTGNYDADLIGNRTCRKFERPPEKRAACNNETMLLQTYLRDTGEVLCDIAMPIQINGRMWGNVRVGMTAEALLAQ
ncbi:MAG: hypothetical protein RIR18_2334 [Pseudomonadota bacterium]